MATWEGRAPAAVKPGNAIAADRRERVSNLLLGEEFLRLRRDRDRLEEKARRRRRLQGVVMLVLSALWLASFLRAESLPADDTREILAKYERAIAAADAWDAWQRVFVERAHTLELKPDRRAALARREREAMARMLARMRALEAVPVLP